MKNDFQTLRKLTHRLHPADWHSVQMMDITPLLDAYDLRGLQIENISRAAEARGDGLYRRVVELEAQLVAWNQKAATWIASPEAAKKLEGYRDLTARIAELEAQNTPHEFAREIEAAHDIKEKP